jgi:voltage-gated potassium channel
MKEQFFDKNVYRYLIGLTVGILIIGTVFYHFVEHFTWVDAYYFCVVTLATVGYGDLTPHTTAGKLFTTVYIFAGVGIITTFITYTVRRRADKVSQRHEARAKRK